VVSSTNKTDCPYITEILLAVALNTITLTLLLLINQIDAIIKPKIIQLVFAASLLRLRGYHTLQGDNSLKSFERFDHMMFVCRFQASP
jgi:hypothetical protein